MRDDLLITCPAWCDRAHGDYSPRATQPSGEALHWRAIRAEHDPAVELARIAQRNTWQHRGTFTSTRPGGLRLELAPYWAGMDLGGPDGDELATTVARGRQLIARLDAGGER